MQHRRLLAITCLTVTLLVTACSSTPQALLPGVSDTPFPHFQGSLPAQPTPALPIPIGSLSIAEVAARVRPAVVQVTNEAVVGTDQFARPVPETNGIGSGVIYDPEGLILTNEHVVAGADQLTVGLPDGRRFSATVVGSDPQTDLAVLRIDGDNLPVAPLGSSSNLVVGDWVVAIGNAVGLSGGPTVTQGIISALDRSIVSPGGGVSQSEQRPTTFLHNLIQTDAPINPGNSGGPLVNLQAQVIGINTAIVATSNNGSPVEGIGFAIGIDTAKEIAAQLVANGRVEHAYLGIAYVPLNPALIARLDVPVEHGVVVTAVDPTSGAAEAGIEEGDIIVSAGGEPLDSESSLGRIISRLRPGATLPFVIFRDGQEQTVQVTLGRQPES